jgi:ribosomal-protein-alanine N-acetyltransferase
MMDDSYSDTRRVRRFEARDIPHAQEIARQSPQAAAWSDESHQAIDRAGQLAWVVESSGGLCGFLIARRVASDEAEILNLAVAPSTRRKGNGTALLQACLVEFSRLHIQRVFLEVRESNLSAISFYETHKFARTGRRTEYYRNPSEAAVLLMRELTD